VIDDEIALVDILDTTGQEEYSAMREQYMRTGEEFLLVYSITSRDSFEETKTFQKQILEFKKKEYWPMILVGNKDDLSSERTVSTEGMYKFQCLKQTTGSLLIIIVYVEGEELAKSFGCPFLETSANTRHNIDKAFFDLLRAICIHSKISREEQERETDESNKEAAARPNLTPLKEKS
jgi:GTPase KRas protein